MPSHAIVKAASSPLGAYAARRRIYYRNARLMHALPSGCVIVALSSEAEPGGVGAAMTVRLKSGYCSGAALIIGLKLYGHRCSIVSERRQYLGHYCPRRFSVKPMPFVSDHQMTFILCTGGGIDFFQMRKL